jgi:hypothetical protein
MNESPPSALSSPDGIAILFAAGRRLFYFVDLAAPVVVPEPDSLILASSSEGTSVAFCQTSTFKVSCAPALPLSL